MAPLTGGPAVRRATDQRKGSMDEPYVKKKSLIMSTNLTKYIKNRVEWQSLFALVLASQKILISCEIKQANKRIA